jgi:5-bromo-4-chloroindolyl phosphate hydrolysis protein
MKEDHTAILAIEAMLNNSMKLIRNKQIMTMEDIAKLYEVTPKEILQTVKREPKRFPVDFMFLIRRHRDGIGWTVL